MSLATRCTQCGTIFKVVQDQLKVSEGWVRCGRCHEVFNALEGLFDLEREAPPARVTQAASPPPPPPADPLPAEVPHPGITHFDLDLPPGDGQPAPAVPSSVDAPSSRLASEDIDLSGLSALNPLNDLSGEPQLPQPGEAPAPQATATPEHISYPETSETDALDSRYLLPNEEAPPLRRRKRRGPDFADAQFPQDLSNEDEWEDAWASGPGELDEAPVAAQAGAAAPLPLQPPVSQSVDTASRANTSEAPRPADAGPSTLPSRFAEDFQPEVALPPPSQRPGKPGTRGRAPQPEAPGFVRQAERRAIWRHPAVRGLLSLMALTLGLLLAGQAAHHWRNDLAAHQPATAPWLARWCEAAGCQLQPPQQLDDLQVDNIQLVRTPSEGDDTYRLTAIIHNRATIDLSWPQLDLNLTDPNGQVLVRRVFQVTDARLVPHGDAPEGSKANKAKPLGPVPPSVPANAQTTVQWQLRAPDLKLAGYTAELFYP
jgi:predicted Zn finger-like uncharacterized protein